MGKESGLGANYYVDGVDLSGDTREFGKITKAMMPIENTGINKFAFERIAGQLSGAIDWTAYFNPTAGQAHPTLANQPRTDRIVTYLHKATVLGTPAASMVLKQLTYDPKRSDKGEVTIPVKSLSNAYWLDWGLSLTTGKRTDTAATAPATGVDYTTVSSAFGLQFYVHLFAFTGTSVTFSVFDSADNVTFAAVAGAASTAMTAIGSQRIESPRAGTVRRYLKVNTTGTFSNAVFAVMATINRTEMTI